MYIKRSENINISISNDSNFVVTNVKSGQLLELNETGTYFLSLLDDDAKDIDEIVTQLSKEYTDIDPKELRNDFVAYMSELAQQNFVEIGNDREQLDLKSLRNLHIDITMQCNERCVHCYIPNYIKNKVTMMAFEDFCHIVDEFILLGGEEVEISGGEPMLHPDFMSMVEYCSKRDLTVQILSNLTLLTDAMMEQLKSYNIGFIQTSVYSLDSVVHDAITKSRHSLSKTISAIEKLQNEKFKVAIACPIMAQNKDHLLPLYEYCEKNNIILRSNACIVPQMDGNADFVEDFRLCLKQKETPFGGLLQKMPSYLRENILVHSSKSKDYKNYPDWFSRQPVCDAAVDSCSLSPDGDVFACPEWTAFKLGNIHEQSLKDIWMNSENIKRIRHSNKRKNFSKCFSCEAMDYCKLCLLINDSECGDITTNSSLACDDAFLNKKLIGEYNEKGLEASSPKYN